jgi:hypothetical protein
MGQKDNERHGRREEITEIEFETDEGSYNSEAGKRKEGQMVVVSCRDWRSLLPEL